MNSWRMGRRGWVETDRGFFHCLAMIDTREGEGARDSAGAIHLDSFFLLPHWDSIFLKGSSLVVGANPWPLKGII